MPGVSLSPIRSTSRKTAFNANSKKTSFANSTVASVALEAEIDECHQRLVSGEILMSTAALNTNTNTNSRAIAIRSFVGAFEAELHRLGGVLSSKRSTIESSGEALLKDADGLSRRRDHGKLPGNLVEKECRSLRERASSLQTKTLKIVRYATTNQKEFSRIAFRADSKLGTSCKRESEREFSKSPWTDTGSSGYIVKLLSDIFSLIREIEEDADKKDGTWVAPQTFERVTTKYWVKEEDLPEVLLKSASELPLLVYGKSGLLTKNPKNPSEGGKVDFWKSMAAPITSVYFDSDDCELYRERLKRSEGAKLVRVRWYGAKKPGGNSTVFLELKTHHESWINNKSVKERVNIPEKRMNSLIDISSGPWTTGTAEEIVAEAATPEMTKEEKDAATALLVEIRALVCELKLKPCVRTSYTRAAFQCPKNNNLRMTIDRDITVVDEKMARRHRNKNNKNNKSWCIEDNDVVPIEAFAKVPYGVFEVKVASGESPDLVEDLERSVAIVEVPKFSKFLTGASLHNSNLIETLPWWSKDELFAPMYNRRALGHSAHSRSSTENPADNGRTSLISNDERSTDQSFYSSGDSDIEEGEYLQPLETAGFINGKRKSEEKSRRSTLVAEAVTSLSDSIRESYYMLTGKAGSTTERIAPRSPARVEPKSFFANERTLIQWITIGSLFMFVAGLVYAAGLSMGPRQGQPFMMFGNSLIACALFIVLYGCFIYYRRLYLMINARPYGYADTFGPAMLGFFMVTLLLTFVYIYHVTFPHPNAQLREMAGMCVKRSLDYSSSRISAFQFEPSAVVVDSERDLILIASLDEIIALPAGLPTDNASINAPIKIVHEFKDGTEDLEALEIINGTVYALSEGKKSSNNEDQSDVIALEWTSDGLLKETKRWRTKAPNAEGMAYIDDPEWFSDPYVMLAGDLRELVPTNIRLEMTGARYPFEESTSGEGTKLLSKHLNNKFFVQNLSDTKIASMQFIEGLLYVLYNNEKLIRAYNSAGDKVNEWDLPVAAVFYDEMWEGMRLEQDGNQLYLHLALDSPPQVWTLKLEGDTSPGSGQWELPKCAS